jgi:3-dehydroquinate synthetase
MVCLDVNPDLQHKLLRADNVRNAQAKQFARLTFYKFSTRFPESTHKACFDVVVPRSGLLVVLSGDVDSDLLGYTASLHVRGRFKRINIQGIR